MAIRRRRAGGPGQSLEQIVSETSALVTRLLRENRSLKAENERLSRELERASRGWEEIRKLTRSAPRTLPTRRR